MLKACHYCGRIHKKDYDCGKKPVKRKRYSNQNTFRNTSIWQKKREEIKQRDNYICQACFHKKSGTIRQFNPENLSVHHIISLEEDYEKRLDNDNLITLCEYHHERAEDGSISVEELQSWIPPGGAKVKL